VSTIYSAPEPSALSYFPVDTGNGKRDLIRSDCRSSTKGGPLRGE